MFANTLPLRAVGRRSFDARVEPCWPFFREVYGSIPIENGFDTVCICLPGFSGAVTYEKARGFIEISPPAVDFWVYARQLRGC